MRLRILPVASILIAIAALLSPRDTAAGWQPDGVDVCPACGWSIYREPALAGDGAGGAYVSTWDGGRGLQIHHLLANGDLDPGWPGYGINPTDLFGLNFAGALREDGAGGVYVAWVHSDCVSSCTRLDGGPVHLQRFTSIPTIFPGWHPEGIQVTDMGVNTPPLLERDGHGGIVICMQQEAYTDTSDVLRVARIDGSGTRIWPSALSGGLVAPRSPKSEDDPSLAADGSGGAFVAWSDRRGPVPQIYLQHFDAAGNIADSSGVAVTSAPLAQRRPRLLSDGVGGVFLAWEDSSATSGRHLRAQRFDSSLQAQWGSGVAVTPGVAGDQIYVALASDEAGGLFLDWIDRRSGSYQVYAVRLDAGGGAVSPWPAGGEPIAAGPNIVPGPSGSFYASGGTTATHVQADGTLAPGIPAQGVALCTGNCGPIETGAYLAADGTGGAIVAWDEWRPGPNPRQELEHSFAAKIGETGIVATLASLVSAEASPGEARLEWQLGEPATIDVERAESASGSAVAWSSLARASSDASGRLIVVDTSVRPGTRYGYRLVKNEGATVAVLGETWLDVPAASTLSLAGARPNPTSGELSLAFSLRDGSPATLELLDVSGRRVASRRIETLGAGGHVVRFGEASRLAPGIYTARLTQGGRAVTAHVAVVR